MRVAEYDDIKYPFYKGSYSVQIMVEFSGDCGSLFSL